MKYKLSWLLPALLLTSVSIFAQNRATSTAPAPVLHNNDVLLLVQDGIKPIDIVTRIVTSPCEFDTFPPVIQDLKQRGVPETVLLAMKMVPYGPPAHPLGGRAKAPIGPETRPVRIPAGTLLNVEPTRAVSSADVVKGTPITFIVTRRIVVDGTLAIDHGAAVNGRVIRRNRPALFGRGGSLEFALEDVVAVDGTRVPIQLSKEVKGNNHTGAVAAGAIITGAIVFPYTAPVALIWGLKKGDEAVLDQGTQLTAMVKKSQEVAGLPTEAKPIYHPVNTLTQETRSANTGIKPFNKSFQPTSIKQR
jgi:hypothetical protein